MNNTNRKETQLDYDTQLLHQLKQQLKQVRKANRQAYIQKHKALLKQRAYGLLLILIAFLMIGILKADGVPAALFILILGLTVTVVKDKVIN